MATIDDYINIAPTIMSIGEFTLEQIETKLESLPSAPEPNPEPEITKAKVVGIFNLIFNSYDPRKAIVDAGGYAGIAQQAGLSMSQVKTIVKEIKAVLGLYRSEQQEE